MAPDWIPWVIAAITAVLGGGGIAAVLKARPEAGQISVSAAQGAVVVQSSVIDDLREQMDSQKKQLQEQADEIKELKIKVAHTWALESALEDAQSQNAELRKERDGLRKRVDTLEAEVRKLKKTVNGSPKPDK